MVMVELIDHMGLGAVPNLKRALKRAIISEMVMIGRFEHWVL